VNQIAQDSHFEPTGDDASASRNLIDTMENKYRTNEEVPVETKETIAILDNNQASKNEILKPFFEK